MIEGPQGQKRPAGTLSAVVMVSKFPTGGLEDGPRNVARDQRADTAARTAALSQERRTKVSKAVALARWS